MNITISKPCAVSEQGGRLNNEDAVYPAPEAVANGQRLFLVCDGVGGANRGEVASALACESIHTYFDTFLEGDPDRHFIQKSIQYTESRFDAYVEQHPEAIGMATTVTLLYVGQEGITVAHVGDSRVYQFRKGRILHRTEDHSLVNSLLKLGKITPEEAVRHPQRHVILRAVQAGEHPVEVEVSQIRDVEPGDAFLLCTDGVLEKLSDEALSEIFAQETSAGAIKDALLDACQGKTRDNFSFYILTVQQVKKKSGIKQNVLSFLYSLV
ncbi:MAG: PP2C family protein-serine/threonine phosphatase [Parabacteroides sp.]